MANPFGEVGSQLFNTVFSGIIWFGIAAIVVIVLGVFMWYFLVYKRKFDIRVKIKSDRADDKDQIIFDKAAILRDRKTGTNYFKLWGLGKDFPVPRYNVLQRTSQGDYLEIYRKGENEFYFLTPSQVNKTKVIKADGKIYAFASQEQNMVDPEMGFWIAKRMDQNKKMFDTENIFMKILPYLPHIIGGMFMVFVLYILLDHLPGILSTLRELVESMKTLQRGEAIAALAPLILKWKK